MDPYFTHFKKPRRGVAVQLDPLSDPYRAAHHDSHAAEQHEYDEMPEHVYAGSSYHPYYPSTSLPANYSSYLHRPQYPQAAPMAAYPSAHMPYPAGSMPYPHPQPYQPYPYMPHYSMPVPFIPPSFEHGYAPASNEHLRRYRVEQPIDISPRVSYTRGRKEQFRKILKDMDDMLEDSRRPERSQASSSLSFAAPPSFRRHSASPHVPPLNLQEMSEAENTYTYQTSADGTTMAKPLAVIQLERAHTLRRDQERSDHQKDARRAATYRETTITERTEQQPSLQQQHNTARLRPASRARPDEDIYNEIFMETFKPLARSIAQGAAREYIQDHLEYDFRRLATVRVREGPLYQNNGEATNLAGKLLLEEMQELISDVAKDAVKEMVEFQLTLHRFDESLAADHEWLKSVAASAKLRAQTSMPYTDTSGVTGNSGGEETLSSQQDGGFSTSSNKFQHTENGRVTPILKTTDVRSTQQSAASNHGFSQDTMKPVTTHSVDTRPRTAELSVKEKPPSARRSSVAGSPSPSLTQSQQQDTSNRTASQANMADGRPKTSQTLSPTPPENSMAAPGPRLKSPAGFDFWSVPLDPEDPQRKIIERQACETCFAEFLDDLFTEHMLTLSAGVDAMVAYNLHKDSLAPDLNK